MADVREILITGGAGQIGLELQAVRWPANIRIHAPSREKLDLTDPVHIARCFAVHRYAAVINPAAYTAVDKAEKEVSTAFAVNAYGPALLAQATREAGIPLIQVSTDYVFDGSTDRPYVEEDPVVPLGVYGASKLAGELAVRTGNPRSLVLRTSWVVSRYRANFLKTMLRVAETRSVLRVVNDQIGCPTSAGDIADALARITLRLIEDKSAPTGIYQFVGAGETSWAGLAHEIFRSSAELGGIHAEVEAITTAEYPTPARRPTNSRLSTAKLTRDYGIVPRAWEAGVREIVRQLLQESVRA